MVQNPPKGTPRIIARLGYDDPKAAIQFLEKAFGFKEREGSRLERGDGSIILTEIDIVDSYIMIGGAGGHGIASPKSNGQATSGLLIYIDDLDQHFENAKAAGATIVSEPTDQYWGDRRYEAKDPEGHLWSFFEHVRDVSAEEIAKAEAAFR